MPRAPLVALALLLSACNTTINHWSLTTTSGGTTRPSMEDETGDEDEEDPDTSTTGDDTSSSSGNLADTGSTSLDTSTTTGADETTGTETTSTTTSADDTTTTADESTTSTTTGEPDPCGNGVIDADEQCDGATPHPGVGCSDACAYDFGSISQLFCAGSCSWAGASGCDAADADVFCRLRTGNPEAHATAFELGAPTNKPGLACANLEVEFPGPDPRVNLGMMPGVDKPVLTVADLQGTHGGGATAAIVAVTCAE